MNQEALNTLIKDLKETGTLIVDSTSVTTVPETKAKVYKIPITETAKETFREALYANMVMLGALIKTTGIVNVNAAEKSIRESVSRRTIETNVRAFKKGLELTTAIV
jgi:2-oxoglutarate ferredoxin oxidoreductase subunit gamma